MDLFVIFLESCCAFFSLLFSKPGEVKYIFLSVFFSKDHQNGKCWNFSLELLVC